MNASVDDFINPLCSEEVSYRPTNESVARLKRALWGEFKHFSWF